MSRQIGGTSAYGTATYGLWSYSNPSTPFIEKMIDDPADDAGVLFGPSAPADMRFIVELLDPNAGGTVLYGTAVYGTDLYSDSVGDWVDVSDRVRGLSWRIGVSDPTQKASVGTGTISFDNRDGAMSPWAMSGDFFGPTRSWIRAGLIVRFGVLAPTVGADDGGDRLIAAGVPDFTYEEPGNFTPLFTGRVTDVSETMTENIDSQIDLVVAESSTDLAVGGSANIPAGKEIGSAILGQLTHSGWLWQNTLTLPDDNATCQESVLIGGSVNSRVGLLADGLHWDIVPDTRGRMRVLRRRTKDDARSPGYHDGSGNLTYFSNYPDVDYPERPLVTAQPYTSDERIVNALSASRAGADALELQDNNSIAQFGKVTDGYGFPRTDLVLETDEQVSSLLRRVLSLRAWGDYGIAAVELNADMDPVAMPAVLAFYAGPGRFETALGIRWVHPSGAELTDVYVIEGQSHNITPQGDQLLWTATFQLGHAGPIHG